MDGDIVQGLLGAKDTVETAARDFINKRMVTNEVGLYEALPGSKRSNLQA